MRNGEIEKRNTGRKERKEGKEEEGKGGWEEHVSNFGKLSLAVTLIGKLKELRGNRKR